MKEMILKWMRKQFIITSILFIVLAAIVILAYANFYDKVEAKQAQNTENYLKNIANAEEERLNLKFGGYLSELEMLASFVASCESAYSSDVVKILKDYQDDHEPVKVDIVFQNGNGIMEGPLLEDVTEYEFYYDVFEGKSGIYGGIDSAAGKNSILFAYPINSGKNEIEACILAAYPEEEFEDFSAGSIFADQTTTFISEKDGTLLSKTAAVGNKTNLFEILGQEGADVFDTLKSQIQKGKSGLLTYGSDKSLRYIIYEQLTYGDLYMVTILSASVIEPSSNYIADSGLQLSAVIVACFMLYIVYLMLVYIVRGKKMAVYFDIKRRAGKGKILFFKKKKEDVDTNGNGNEK